ncbi:hypothetical protein RYX36_021343 [Vicia faba]
MLKINEEILFFKKQHSHGVAGMKREMDGIKELFKTMIKQQNPHMSDEEISNMMETALGSSNSTTATLVAPHLSALTHISHCEENGDEEACHQDMEEEEEGDDQEEEYYDA